MITVDLRTSTTSAKLRLWFVAALATSLSTVILVSAWLVFPPTSGDDAVWLEAAVNYRGGHGAVSTFTYFTRVMSHPPVEGALVAYPLLYVFLLSVAMTAPTYAAAVQAAALIKVASLVLLAWGWTRLAVRVGSFGWAALACVAGGLGAQFSLLFMNYRPEVGVVFVLSVFVVLLSYGFRGPAVWGVTLGLIAGANPMCGLLFSGMAVMFFAREKDAAGTVRATLVTGAVSILVFFGVLAAGWGIFDTLRATANASRGQFYVSFNPIGSLHYLFGHKNAFLAGLPGIVGIAALGAYASSHELRNRPLFFLGFVFLIAIILEASILRTEQVYNVFAFLPVVVAFFVLQGETSRHWQVAGAMSLCLAASGAVIALAALGLHVSAGVKFEEAHRAWQRLKSDGRVTAGERVVATTSLWGLADSVEDRSRFRRLEDKAVWNAGKAVWDPDMLRGSPILIQQIYASPFLPNRTLPPRELRVPDLGIDHLLAVDLFNRRVPRLFGVALGESVPGWGFAVYLPRGNAVVGPKLREKFK